MFVLGNALKSISRSLGRNILIGIIVFTIAVAACVSLAIKKAANDAQSTGLENMTISATVSVDRAKLMEEQNASASESQQGGRMDMNAMRELLAKYPDLTLDQQQTLATSNYVKAFDYSYTTNMNASGELKAFTQEEETEEEEQPQGDMPGGDVAFSQGGTMRIRGGMALGGIGMAQGDFAVTGYSSDAAMTAFINGESTVVEGGTMFDTESADMACIISEELALVNGLKVGDSLTLANPSVETEIYTLKVTGIYTTPDAEANGMPMFSTSMDPANAIYVSYKTLESMINTSKTSAVQVDDGTGNTRSSELGGTLSSSFTFANPEDFEGFKKDVANSGLSEYYVVNSNDVSNFEASLVPLKNVSNFANTLLIIILIVGAIVLIVLNIFNIRERKFEVGVLTAIGVKKGTVALQFVTELLIVTMISIILGSAAGAVASVPVSGELLSSQIQTMEQEQEQENQNFGRQGVGFTQGGGPVMIQGGGIQRSNLFGQDVDYINTINASVNLTVLLQMIIIGLALAVISSLAAVIFVLRYEPLKILANRA